ncbi:MAG: hypothetical protein ACYCW6_19615 [Candidatus Xenobia bacterium]
MRKLVIVMVLLLMVGASAWSETICNPPVDRVWIDYATLFGQALQGRAHADAATVSSLVAELQSALHLSGEQTTKLRDMLRTGLQPGQAGQLSVQLPLMLDDAQREQFKRGMIQARAWGMTTSCRANLRNISTAIDMYRLDNHGSYPPSLQALMPKYLFTVPRCPAGGSYDYKVGPSGRDFEIICSGQNHRDAGLPADYPRLSRSHGVEIGPGQQLVGDRVDWLVNQAAHANEQAETAYFRKDVATTRQELQAGLTDLQEARVLVSNLDAHDREFASQRIDQQFREINQLQSKVR